MTSERGLCDEIGETMSGWAIVDYVMTSEIASETLLNMVSGR